MDADAIAALRASMPEVTGERLRRLRSHGIGDLLQKRRDFDLDPNEQFAIDTMIPVMVMHTCDKIEDIDLEMNALVEKLAEAQGEGASAEALGNIKREMTVLKEMSAEEQGHISRYRGWDSTEDYDLPAALIEMIEKAEERLGRHAALRTD